MTLLVFACLGYMPNAVTDWSGYSDNRTTSQDRKSSDGENTEVKKSKVYSCN